MSYRKPCPRTLDRPIVVFGLEPDELVLVGLAAGAILFAWDPVPAVLCGGGLWLALSRIKAGKPPGHLFELLYRTGVLARAPEWLRTSHLIPRRVRRLDVFPGGDDDAVRAYWPDRPRLDS